MQLIATPLLARVALTGERFHCAEVCGSLILVSALLFPAIAAAQNACTPPPSGLVGWWDGDAVSATTAIDIAGGNDGTMFGGVGILQGKVGYAFAFNHITSVINVGNPDSLNFGFGPFSLEAWVNWNEGVFAQGAGSFYIISKKVDFFSEDGYRLSGDFPAGPIGHPFFDVGLSNIEGPVAFGWHHVAATRDSLGAMTLYVDGELQTSMLAPSWNTSSAVPFLIGGGGGGSLLDVFAGLIDEVSVYDRALDASEIQAIFNAGSAGKCKRCQLRVTPPFLYQSDTSLRRVPQPYFGGQHIPGCTTKVYGCALLTSSNMLRTFRNSPLVGYFPDSLDLNLIAHNGYESDCKLYFDAIAPATNHLTHIVGRPTHPVDLNSFLDQHFCQDGNRAILALDEYVNNAFRGSHYVLVTGKETSSDWRVFDPGWNAIT